MQGLQVGFKLAKLLLLRLHLLLEWTILFALCPGPLVVKRVWSLVRLLAIVSDCHAHNSLRQGKGSAFDIVFNLSHCRAICATSELVLVGVLYDEAEIGDDLLLVVLVIAELV